MCFKSFMKSHLKLEIYFPKHSNIKSVRNSLAFVNSSDHEESNGTSNSDEFTKAKVSYTFNVWML